MRSLFSRFILGFAAFSACCAPVSGRTPTSNSVRRVAQPSLAVGPQYDTTHVYVAPAMFDRLVESLVATFGGTTRKRVEVQVTPTTSRTMSQLVLTPVGTISVLGFTTPIPYPFGIERTGYLVRDIDVATRAARLAGASVLVAPFPDPVGRDVIVQWPGGINMQLYWHTVPPDYVRLDTVPENRIYISNDAADPFILAWKRFSQGRIVSDERKADGRDVGRVGTSFRRVRLLSSFGRLTLLVTDGHLPWPYGRELAGYEVSDLTSTLARARAAGATVLVEPYGADGRAAALVEFPGGYIAEIHALEPGR